MSSAIATIYTRFVKVVSQAVTWSNVSGGDYSDDYTTTITSVPTGYTAKGVCGYNMSGTGYSKFVVVKNYISSGKLDTKVRNNDSSARTVTGTFYILCVYTG